MTTNALKRNVLLVFIGASLTILSVVVVVRWQLIFELIAAMLLAIGVIAILVAEKRGMAVGLIVIALTFILGYRTFSVTPEIRLHPGELIVWGLMILAFVQLAVSPDTASKKMRIPTWLWIFIFFWLWGWIRGLTRGQSWDAMLAELKNVALLMPMYIVVQLAASERRTWQWVSVAMFFVGTTIAAFGLLEYFFPLITNYLPGIVTSPNPVIDPSGFRRATFSFWGTPAATFVIVLTIPFTISLWSMFTNNYGQAVIVLGAIIQFAGILVGGYRSIWVIFLIQLLVLAWLRGRFRIGLIVFGPIITILVLEPTAAILRFSTLFSAIQGFAVDTSAANRIQLISQAFESIVTTPAGIGWAGIGWAHSDVLQIAANLGVIAGILLIIAYSQNIAGLLSGVQRKDNTEIRKNFFITFLLAMVGVGGLLAVQGVHVLPQLVLPVWLIWVLADEFAHLETEEVPEYEDSQA